MLHETEALVYPPPFKHGALIPPQPPPPEDYVNTYIQTYIFYLFGVLYNK